MFRLYSSNKYDKKLTVSEFLELLRSTQSQASIDSKLKQYPNFISVALDDKGIFEKMGGQEGIKTFSCCSLEVCREVIASNAYKSLDEDIKQQIKTIEYNLEVEKRRFAAKKPGKEKE